MKKNALRAGTVFFTAALGLSGAVCNQLGGGGGDSSGVGTLRVLVTDKPYPFDMISEALVTVTKIEVRASGVEICDEECDDALYCNGTESCVDGECRAGIAPCAADEVCDESADACLPSCETGADCDDGVYCNGIETCDTGTMLCQAGTPPCDDGLDCDEDVQACTGCTSDDQCDDGLHCNGVESCFIDTGICMVGEAVACADGEECDEDADACGPPSEDASVSPYVVIFEGEKILNLLDLQNGRTDLLTDAEIPAGSYNLVRIHVTEGKVTLIDGREFSLRVPSGEQTGIKLHFDFVIVDGAETTLLLDVDLSKAFRAIPSGHVDDPSTIRSFQFTPSIAMRLIDLLDAGSIAGTVTAEDADGTLVPLTGVSVTAYDAEGEEVTSTATADDGTYVLGGLPTGEYRLEFSLTGYDEAELAGINVAAGATTEGVDLTLIASQ